MFRYGLPETGHALLRVHDLRGRLVRVLANHVIERGEHVEVWDGMDARGIQVPAGVYFVRLSHPRGTLVEKVLRVL